MAINRSNEVRQLQAGLNTIFGEYKTLPPMWPEIFETETSTKAYEDDVKVTGFGTAETKVEGGAVTYDIANEAYAARYVHETVTKAFAITQEAFEDNLYMSQGRRYVQSLKRAMFYTKDVKGAAILNRAFSASYLGGDGKRLCATDHPTWVGGTNSNRPTTGVDLNEASLEAAVIAIAAFTDERGLLIQASPKKLIIPTAYMFTAERILRSTNRVGTADNDINALRAMSSIPGGWAVNKLLTDSNAWFLLTDIPNGLKHFQRIAMEQNMEGDFDTGNIRYKCRERYIFGWSDPLGIYGSPGGS